MENLFIYLYAHRWGNSVRCHHGDFLNCDDKYNPGVLQKHKWENAMSIDR